MTARQLAAGVVALRTDQPHDARLGDEARSGDASGRLLAVAETGTRRRITTRDAPGARQRRAPRVSVDVIGGHALVERVDLRLLPATGASYVAVWLAVAVSPFIGIVGGSLLAAVGVLALGARRPGPRAGILGMVLLSAAASGIIGALHRLTREAGPVPAMAVSRTKVEARLVVTGDPRQVTTRWGKPLVVVPARLEAVGALGEPPVGVGNPITVMVGRARPDDVSRWKALLPSTGVIADGRLTPPGAGFPEAAVLATSGPPRVIAAPSTLQRDAGALRADLRRAVRGLPPDERGLVPGLVIGDTSAEPPSLIAAFRDTGLTHLVAASGENLVLTIGALVPLLRGVGVRGRWIAPLAALAVIGFTILARPTPSMVRASLMALLALLVGVTGRRRSGVPLLCAATLALLLGSPSLSHEYGFALSVAATAGLFLLAPRWRERLAAWLPERVAESLACVAAAELCCLPIVAALAGSVSLLGVPANLLVDIAVGPATVLGALALVCGASLQPLGVLCAWLAQWPAAWIVLVARAGSRVPGARLPWPAGWRGALLLLLGYAVIACLTLRRAASHRHRGSRLYQGADAMNGHERSPVDQAGVDRITDGHAGGALRRPDAIAVISLVPTSLRGASRRAATIIPPKVLAARQPTPDHGLADAAARDEPTRTGRGSLVPTVPRTASKARSGHRLSATHGMLTPMPRNPQTQNSTGPSPLTIAVGPEELLAERAIADVIAAARAVAPDTQVAEIGAAAFTPGEFAQLVSPSLFGERTIVVLRAAQDLSGANVKVVVDYLAAPVDEVALVMTHAGGAKGKALLDAARKNGATVVDCAKITKPGDRIAFVRHEFRDAGRTVSEDAARALIDAVGSDLRELAAACSQLAADATGPIDEAFVARYYSGRAETSGFIVADRAVEGRAADALEQLRWALATGVAPVLITSALAQGVRSIARLGSAPRGMRPADLARELGMPPWKVDRVRSQLRGWTPDGIGRALRAVAEADAAVKGGGDDPAYALERAVLAITDARASRS